MLIRNILRLIGILFVIALVVYGAVWAIGNRDKIFNTSTPNQTQTATDTTSQTSSTNNTTQEQTQPTPNISDTTSEPKLTDLTPIDNFTTSDDKVTISGKTDTGNKVTINNQEIPVDQSGNFSRSITLNPGTNRIRVVAKDPNGKEISTGLIYTRNTAAAQNSTPGPDTQNPTAPSQNQENTTQNNTTGQPSTNTQTIATSSQPIRTGGADFIFPVFILSSIFILYKFYPKKRSI